MEAHPVDPNALPLRIDGLEENLTGGVRFFVNYTSPTRSFEQLSLSQNIMFYSTSLDVQVFQPFVADLQNRVLFGARVTDGSRLIYYVFSSAASQREVAVYSHNVTITVPVQPLAWT